MKRIVMIVAGLIMLAGVTISVMKSLALGPFAENGEPTATSGAPPQPPRFVDVEQLLIPIITGDRVVSTIALQIKLETLGAENEATIQRMLPRLSDAFLRDLYAFLPRLLQREERLNPEAINERLQSTAEKVVGKGVVQGVVIQSIADTSRPERRTP